MGNRKQNPLWFEHGRRAWKHFDDAMELAQDGRMNEAREELRVADYNGSDAGRQDEIVALVAVELTWLPDEDLSRFGTEYHRARMKGASRAQMRASLNEAFEPLSQMANQIRYGRRENVDPATAAVISGAIGATTMTTIQTLADNPQNRFTVAQVGTEVVVIKGMRKGEALNAAESVVGAVAVRETAMTFDTRHEAYSYAEEELGAVTRDLGMVENPADVRAIKRRVLR